jgi:hypothetical protein
VIAHALAVLCALVLCSISVPVSAAVQRFAVIVGNNTGAQDDVALRYAESDARKLAEVLRDLGDFQAADLLLLVGEDAESVRRTLISVNDRIRAAQSLPDTETLLFVYFSGHADARGLRLGRSRLDLSEVAQLVRGSAATFRLLMVDACRSGVLTRVKGGRAVPAFDLPRVPGLRGEGLAFLTASAANEDAQESDELRGSFFTHGFVSGLLGAADSDRDGSVVLEEAYRHAYDSTIRATSRTFAGTQHPTFAFEMRGQESLVLTRLRASSSRRAALSFPRGMGFLILNQHAEGAVVAEVLSNSGQRTLSLRPGVYFVRGRGSDALFEGSLRLLPGTISVVDYERLDRVQYARLVRKGAGGRALAHSAELGPAVRSELPNASGACWGAQLAYRLQLKDLTFTGDAGFCSSGFENRALEARTNEYALGASVEHAWDLRFASLSFGAGAGATFTHQSFTSEGLAPDRLSTSPFFFARGRLTKELFARWFSAFELRAEEHLIELKPRATAEAELEPAFAVRGIAALGAQF